MNKPKLSVVIASFNDNEELIKTVASIRATSPVEDVQIVVVDDCSMMPVRFLEGANVIRGTRRVGCGPSRFIGACHAKGEYLLFCDSHMRFSQGWYENAITRIRPQILHCGSCVALGKDENPDTGSRYYGATWNFNGPDRKNPKLGQVFECVWAPEQEGDEYRIPAVMGACYFIHRDWFMYLNPLRHLKLWGGDEQELSLKAWRSGGEIRLLKNVRIGHKFREGKVPSSFVMPWHVMYNKLFIIHSCLPPDMAMVLQMKMQRDMHFGLAVKQLREDWHLVECARAYNNAIFHQSFQWILDQFGLPFPSK